MYSVKEMAKIVEDIKRKNKTVGMITGNFDVLHIGHIELINFAKQNVDILIIGVDANELANMYREKDARIVNTKESRAEVMRNLRSVDYVFGIEYISGKTIEEIQEDIAIQIKPSCIIANPLGDLYYKQRRERCEKLAIKLLELPNTALLK